MSEHGQEERHEQGQEQEQGREVKDDGPEGCLAEQKGGRRWSQAELDALVESEELSLHEQDERVTSAMEAFEPAVALLDMLSEQVSGRVRADAVCLLMKQASAFPRPTHTHTNNPKRTPRDTLALLADVCEAVVRAAQPAWRAVHEADKDKEVVIGAGM